MTKKMRLEKAVDTVAGTSAETSSGYLPKKVWRVTATLTLAWLIRSTFSPPFFGEFELLNWAVSSELTYLRPGNQKATEEACTSTALLEVLCSLFEVHQNCTEMLPVFNMDNWGLVLNQLSTYVKGTYAEISPSLTGPGYLVDCRRSIPGRGRDLFLCHYFQTQLLSSGFWLYSGQCMRLMAHYHFVPSSRIRELYFQHHLYVSLECYLITVRGNF
jgi:hypothetical protein